MAYTTIDNPELYFQTVLWTGNDTNRTITLDGDEDMQPDLVWMKDRDQAIYHRLTDSVRGVGKVIFTNVNNAEQDDEYGTVGSFVSDGFTIRVGANANSTWVGANENTVKYVAWCWKETADAGFDIVSYEGNASGGTHSHSLSAVPHFMIVKNFDAGDQNWAVYHQSLGGTKYLELNNNGAVASDIGGYERWNSTAPTSSVFSAGPSDTTDESSHTHINYLWSEKQGYSKFSSFVGNGADDGTFCYTGHRPSMVFLKGTASNREWIIFNNKTDTFNPIDGNITINSSDAENTGTARIDFLSNGFKLRDAANNYNASGETYIYASFAEAPFVNSNGVPCNAR